LSGDLGGFDFDFWRQSEGEGSMTVYLNGTFDCSWEDADVILFRTGKKMGNPGGRRTINIFKHDELGEITVDYGIDYRPDGNSYLCVYGWTLDPLIEYYIIESWGTWHPKGDELIGSVEIDGGAYDVYVTMRIEEPSINGTQTFAQFWSVRTDKRTEGTISVSEHFKVWDEMGMELGKMFEVAFCVEGIQSSGEANLYRHVLRIGDDTYGDIQETAAEDVADTPDVPDAPDTSGEPDMPDLPDTPDETVSPPQTTANPGADPLAIVFFILGFLTVGAFLVVVVLKSRKNKKSAAETQDKE